MQSTMNSITCSRLGLGYAALLTEIANNAQDNAGME